MLRRIVFWQSSHSPHQFALLDALSKHGNNYEIELVVSQRVNPTRKELSWEAIQYQHVTTYVAPGQAEIELLTGSEARESVHVFSGIAADDIRIAAMQACTRHHAPIAVMAEAADWSGHGPQRYARLAKHVLNRLKYGRHIRAFLPIGQLGVEWYARVGYAREIMTPFAYFVEPEQVKGTVQDIFEVLFVGRAVAYKGGDLLLHALATLRHLTWKATFITQGAERTNWEALAADLHLSDRVTFQNFQPPATVAQSMASASVVVLPNKGDEGWGAVVNEALMQGTPVICTTLTGAKDMIGENRGQVVHPNVEALAHALERQIKTGIPTPAQRDAIAQHTRVHWSGAAGANQLVAALERIK